jgi:hypothetical protein
VQQGRTIFKCPFLVVPTGHQLVLITGIVPLKKVGIKGGTQKGEVHFDTSGHSTPKPVYGNVKCADFELNTKNWVSFVRAPVEDGRDPFKILR